MSVIVKNLLDKTFRLFAKGSPEIIKELCLIDSLPEDYDEIL